VEIYALTMTRIRACCHAATGNRSHTVPDALISHFPLDVQENKEFYDNYLTVRLAPSRPTAPPSMQNHYRFTTIRAPVEQFLSFHHLYVNYNWNRPTHHVRALAELIDGYEAYAGGNASALDDGDAQTFELIANSQSKELGWDGREVRVFSVPNL